MAFRGGPLVSGNESDHARAVVRAALEAAAALSEVNDMYFSRVKIGGASDECLIGAFGTDRRLSYTALGDGVNLAARLDRQARNARRMPCFATRRDVCAAIWLELFGGAGERFVSRGRLTHR